MKYNISLEHIALVKVASTLWNQHNIKELIANYHFGNVPSTDREEWDKIQQKVMEKVPHLKLPMYLREILSCFIKCVGMQLLKWVQRCNETGNVCTKLLNNIVWTPQGTIDRKKTAKTLIENKTIHILTRYRLADINWLMDDIPELWNQIPQNHRIHIISKQEQIQLMVRGNRPATYGYFRLDSSDEEDGAPVESDYQFAVQTAALVDANQEAVEYLLSKLSPRERRETLPSVAAAVGQKNCDFSSKPYSEVLWFLFSEMNEQQQIRLFKIYPTEVCKCLLEYPNQSLFMVTMSRMSSYLHGMSFYWIIDMIINKVIDDYTDYNYRKLFREFWHQSPSAMKKFVMKEPYAGRLLYRLCQIKDRENIKLILETMAVEDKNKLIFSGIPKCICKCIMYCNDWDFLDLFVKECVSSKDEMVRFAEELKAYMTQLNSEIGNHAPEAEKKDRLFHLLDDFVSEYNKRKCTEDDGSHPTKVPCSAERQVVSRAGQ